MERRSKEQVEGLRDDIVEMYGGGVGVEEISKELSVSVPYIYKLLGDAGIELTLGRKKLPIDLPEEMKDQIVFAWKYREGSVRGVLNEFKIGYNILYRVLQERGEDIRAKIDDSAQIRRERLDLAVRMYGEGAPLWQIQDETGIWQPQLHDELHKRRIPTRRQKRMRPEDEPPIRDPNWFDQSSDPVP